MSSIRNPVGPQPPQVYWRRRLLLALGVVAVIVVVILIIVRPGSGAPAANPTDSKAAQPLPSGSASFPATAATDCDPKVITLTPITDAAAYPADQQPQISMSILNAGAKPCKLDVGTKAQVYIITSGADDIWRSTDCQQNPASSVQTLQPGKALTTQPFAWDRTRSSTSTCTADRPQVVAAGASYHLQVKVGDITSADTKQFVLQ